MIELFYNERDPRYIFLMHDGATTQVRKLNRRTRKFEQKEVPEILALEEHLNQIPDYMFTPSFAGIPKPVCFLEKKRFGERIVYYCLTGLWKEIKDWCKKANIQCNGIYNIKDYGKQDKQINKYFVCTDFREDQDAFNKYIDSWNLNLDLRDYQYQAIWKILHYHQSMSQLATRSGKTLMAYCIFRYMLEHGAHNCLMVVPSISLVKQGVGDMNDYQEFFTTEAIWAEGEYCEGANLTIGTFQSLVRRCCKNIKGRVNKHYNPKFFDKFDVVCIDECHKADCESIKQIMDQPFVKNAKLIFGFSGTLPEAGSIESYGCQAMLGPCIQDISTMELVNAGYLAKPILHQIRISYNNDLTDAYIRYGEYLCANFEEDESGKRILLPKEERDMTMIHKKTLPIVLRDARTKIELGEITKQDYRDMIIDMCKASGANLLNLEQMIAEHSQKKLEVMYDLLFSNSAYNGIVFAHNEAYVDFLVEKIQDRFPGRPVYKIKGSTSEKKRAKIKEAMNTQDTDAILVASFGTVATGLTFTNIDYAIFAQSFKSPIIVLQSLGRGLLKTLKKTEFHLYDLIDIFPTERLKKQGEAKTKLYREKNFEYSITHK